MAEEKEANDAEVHDGLGAAWFRVVLELLAQGSQDCEVDRPHMQGGWVLIIPGFRKGSQLVDVMGTIHSGIGEVQLGKLLAHGV